LALSAKEFYPPFIGYTPVMDASRWPEERMNPEVKGGRGPLLVVAIGHGVMALILGNSAADSDPAALRDAFRTDAAINFSLGVIFLGIWFWASADPLKASLTGLALFLAVHVATAILNPVSTYVALIAKIIILAFLIRSVLAARAAKAWEKIEGPR
jgi:hypothetical protein